MQEENAYYEEFARRVTEVLSFSNFDPIESMWSKYEWLQEFSNDIGDFDGSARAMQDDSTGTPLVLDKFVTFVLGEALLEQVVKRIDAEIAKLPGNNPSGSKAIVTSDTKSFVNKYPKRTTMLCLSAWTCYPTNRLRATVIQRLKLFTQLMTNEITSDPFQCIELLKLNGTRSWSTSAAFLLAENFGLKQTIRAQKIKLEKLEIPRECLVYRGCFEHLARRLTGGEGRETESQREACIRFWDLKVDEAVSDRIGPVWDILKTMLVTIPYLGDSLDAEEILRPYAELDFQGSWADLPGDVNLTKPQYSDREMQTQSDALKEMGHSIYGRLSIPIHKFTVPDPDWYSLESGHWREGELQILKALKTLYNS